MASWMVHLRIAEKLLDRVPSLSPTEFIVGNIAPDSGVPNEDWSKFTPSTKVSHFKTGKHNKAEPDSFAGKYFTEQKQAGYTNQQFSFYLGYLVHLLTDVAWSERIYYPAKVTFSQELTEDPDGFVWKLKEDWYDLDFLYLKEHPNFSAFAIYQNAKDFMNTYMEEFSEDAFNNRRQYITGFYLQGKDGLDREYPYLTKAQMDSFTDSCAEDIFSLLKEKYCPQLFT